MLRTVVYSDLFEFPLTRDEIFRFLIALGGPREAIEAAIDHALANGAGIETDGEFVFLAGRRAIVGTRRRRAVAAGARWRRARVYARLIWALPFVRAVAVTGALAVDNVEPGDDIDLLVVTEPGRLWLTRGLIVAVVRLAARFGDEVCPNYIVSTRALDLEERSLYAAHELVHMVLLHGTAIARRVWTVNPWYSEFLPNADPAAAGGVSDELPWPLRIGKRFAEAVLGTPIGGLAERWEQRRKIARLSRRAAAVADRSVFTADVCKGHFDGHGARVTRLFESRLRERGL